MRRSNQIEGFGLIVSLLTCLSLSLTATAQTDKPNILIIWGDDVGMWNISAYHRGILTNLKLDPFERFHEARGYDEWAENRSWLFGQVGPIMAKFIGTFKEFPPSQESMSVQLDDVSTMINSQAMSR